MNDSGILSSHGAGKSDMTDSSLTIVNDDGKLEKAVP